MAQHSHLRFPLPSSPIAGISLVWGLAQGPGLGGQLCFLLFAVLVWFTITDLKGLHTTL